MKWAVIGASGQLGSELIDNLKKTGSNFLAWPRYELDVTQDSAIEMVLSSKPDILVNCAAWTDVEGAETNQEIAFKVNQIGVANMAKAAKALQIPFIHISTDYVFSGEATSPWKVDDPTNPKNVYGKSKLAGENEVLRIYPDKSYIIRTGWLYSKYGSNFPKTILRRLLSTSDVVKVVNDQFGQPTSAQDLAEQIIKMVRKNLPYGTYHGTNGGQTSWYEFARHILAYLGQPADRIISVSSKEYPQIAARPRFSALDHGKWLNSGVSPMTNWSTALNSRLPKITAKVKVELQHD